MANIPLRSPYPGQFITLCFDQLRPCINTQAVIHFLFIHPLFSFVVVRTLKRGYRRSKLVFFTKAPSSPWSHPHRLGSGLLRPDSRLWDCPRTLMSVSSAGWQLHRFAAGLVILHSVSSPCSQYRHWAVNLLALLLAALKSVSQPCSRSRRLAVSLLALCWPH